MRDRIIEILKQVRPEVEDVLATHETLAGVLDSFDVVLIVEEIESAFGIQVDGEAIVPENFESVSALEALVRGSMK